MASDNDNDDDIKYVEQSGSDTPWNLVRISERSKNYSLPYIYDQNAGYVIFLHKTHVYRSLTCSIIALIAKVSLSML